MKDFYKDKVVLVTGAAGTVGKELVRQLIKFAPSEIRLLDNNETELFLLGCEYQKINNIICYLGDVRDEQKLMNLSAGVDIILHAAALKHVALSEYNPFEAVQTNIQGVKNVVQAALLQHVGLVIFTSSDKAVNPTNVMGTSKLMGERIVTAANIVNTKGDQVFSSVRFGNVLGSRGSVVPIFANQIRRREKVTITDPRMTRFIMSIQEAGRLVLEAGLLACGGEVFIPKMPVMRIQDLAQAMIELLARKLGFDPQEIHTAITRANPGEKLYEELMSMDETARTLELKNNFVILPALRAFYNRIDYNYKDVISNNGNLQPYNSSTQVSMTIREIKDYLEYWQVLDEFVPKDDDQYLRAVPRPKLKRL